MINKSEAKAIAWLAIANLIGVEYFRAHFNDSCHSYPDEIYDDVNYEYFIGFEGDKSTGLWTVFARVNVNRKTEKVTFLDYRTPEGKRMESPIKPIRWAEL